MLAKCQQAARTDLDAGLVAGGPADVQGFNVIPAIVRQGVEMDLGPVHDANVAATWIKLHVARWREMPFARFAGKHNVSAFMKD